MKTAASRDAMVALVKQTFEQHPSFFSLPRVNSATAQAAQMRMRVPNPDDDRNYVLGLYRLCAGAGVPTGRRGNDLVVS